MTIRIGDRIRFAPNPRFPSRTVEAKVTFHRCDPRPSIKAGNVMSANAGWLDTVDDSGFERSVRPSRATVV